jgi:hypothetical protein
MASASDKTNAVAAERDVLPRQTLLLSWRKSLGENPPNRAPMTKGARGSGSMPAMPARSTRLTRPRSGFKRKDARHDDGTDSNASLTSLQRSQCPNIVRTACAGGAQCCVATDFFWGPRECVTHEKYRVYTHHAPKKPSSYPNLATFGSISFVAVRGEITLGDVVPLGRTRWPHESAPLGVVRCTGIARRLELPHPFVDGALFLAPWVTGKAP